MKAPDFNYESPLSLEEALRYVSNEEIDCQPLAGGQSLIPMMNLRLAGPELLLDLNKVAELDFIDETESQIQIGAMVRYSALMHSDLLHENVPLFSHALPYIAHEAIRNRGTIGGSVALADPAAEMPALLKALNASINVVSITGKREIPADEFFIGVYHTALEFGELVHSVSIPKPGDHQRFGFYEIARRHGDYAMAGVAISAASIEPFVGLRIVFFSVAGHAIRAIDAESVLEGEHFSNAAIDKAVLALSSLEFNEDMNASEATKAHLAGVVLRRALTGMCLENS